MTFGSSASAQNYVWAKNYVQAPTYVNSNASGPMINAMATDSIGNVYVAGAYEDTITVGGNTLYENSNYGWNFFMAKVEPNGLTDWAYPISRANMQDAISDVKTSSYLNTPFYCSNSLIATILPNGTTQAILYIPQVSIKKIATQGGIVYFAGLFQNHITINGSTFYSDSATGSLIGAFNFVTGHYVWIKQISQTTSVNAICGLEVDTAGNIFISGSIGPSGFFYYYYADSSVFDNITVHTNGESNGFVAKINNAGNYEWVKNYGLQNIYCYGMGIGLDNQQHIYFVNRQDEASSLNGYQTRSDIVKLDETGHEIWNRLYPRNDFWSTMACTDQGIFLTGGQGVGYSDTLYLIDTLLINSFSNYVLHLDTAGKYRWLAGYEGNSTGSASINHLATAKNGLVYSTGGFQGALNIGSSELVNPNNNNNISFDYLALINSMGDSASGNATISGRIFIDSNSNCLFDSTSIPAKSFGVIATPGNYIAVTDGNGRYSLSVPPGNYTVNEILPEFDEGSVTRVCPAGAQYSTGQLNSGAVDTGNNFANQISRCNYAAVITSPYGISIVCDTPFNAPVSFCNYSNNDIDSVEIQIGISDSISSISTKPPYSYRDQLTNKLVFTNMQFPADTCITIIVMGVRLCTSWELGMGYTPPYPLTISAQISNMCSASIGLNYDSTSIQVPMSVGIGNLSPETGVKVFPNPFQDDLFIVPDNEGDTGRLTVCDITGKEFANAKLNGEGKIMLDLNYLASGAYILSYKNAQGVASKLVIKK